MSSKIGFDMSLIIVEAIRGQCASFMSLPATVSEIFGGQATPSILVVSIYSVDVCTWGHIYVNASMPFMFKRSLVCLRIGRLSVLKPCTSFMYSL